MKAMYTTTNEGSRVRPYIQTGPFRDATRAPTATPDNAVSAATWLRSTRGRASVSLKWPSPPHIHTYTHIHIISLPNHLHINYLPWYVLPRSNQQRSPPVVCDGAQRRLSRRHDRQRLCCHCVRLTARKSAGRYRCQL